MEIEGLVSIIIVIENNVNTNNVKLSIDSINNQSYKKTEIMFIMRDSEKEDIIKAIKKNNNIKNNNNIKIVQANNEKSLFQLLKKGVEISNGEFVILENNFNISLKKRIEKQLKYFKNNPQKDIVGCLIKCRDNTPLSKSISTFHNKFINENDINNSIRGGELPLFLNTLMIRKRLLKNIFNIDYKEDEIDIILELFKYSPIEKVNEKLYLFNECPISKFDSEKQYYSIVDIKLGKFNKDKMIEYRSYLAELRKTTVNTLKYKGNKNILIVIEQLNLGGTETHIFSMCKILSKMGINIYIATSGGILRELFIKNGFKIIDFSLKFNKSTNTFSNDNYLDFKNIIDRFNIKLVHCHLEKEMIFCKSACKKFKIPYGVTLHGMFYSKDLISNVCKDANFVIAVSEPVKLLCDKLGIESTVIFNGVNISERISSQQNIYKELNIPNNSNIITYCSRLSWGKGKVAELFLNGIEEILFKYDDLHIVIVGEGDKRYSIENYAASINKRMRKEVIHIVGAKYNVKDYYVESILVVGTGRVALEGMSVSKPVLAFGGKCYAGIVKYDTCDRVLKSYFGDHDTDTTNKYLNLKKDIEYLLTHEKERLEIGIWSKNWCSENFNEEDMGIKVNEIYNKILF
ncbi:Glycosyltransferase involved in cell wall bisynthesis [Clostridium cavendishii DSM 21758]|uniref:Glycosyltransferase involved in cell wall bisynthesis n=1 Tax=Clostridium cavendishii DSM 21758 TaxID=1121302 RepID=A0A1M6EYQ2_9CLOT|nr:glycosyltransferase [Clostridium cavendishii]SHI90531.1 Glycosyltransferase involved in cell wall bisynthesis [Clostridium cavendishii DSM 21758]